MCSTVGKGKNNETGYHKNVTLQRIDAKNVVSNLIGGIREGGI